MRPRSDRTREKFGKVQVLRSAFAARPESKTGRVASTRTSAAESRPEDGAIQAALAGLELAYVFERSVRARVKTARLVAVLDDRCPTFPGMVLQYPGHRHVSASLGACIELLKVTRIA